MVFPNSHLPGSWWITLISPHFPLCKTIPVSLHKSSFQQKSGKRIQPSKSTQDPIQGMKARWLRNEQQWCPKKVDLTVFINCRKPVAEDKHTWFMVFLRGTAELSSECRKGCESSLEIMPSLIILNVNYSEVHTETKNLFPTKKLDILIGPSE